MSEATTSSTPASKPARGVKRGLPTHGLRQAEESAVKLWGVARKGMASKQEFGSEVGLPGITGGSFRTRMALLNGFGLITSTEDEIGLSDLGLDLVQDYDEKKRQGARRGAVLKLKAYREIVETFDETELLPRDKLAAKLKFEYGKTDEFAKQAADALIDSLKFAEILDAQNLVHKDGILAGPENGQIPSDLKNAETPTADHESPPGETAQVPDPDEDEAAAELDDAFGGDDESELARRASSHRHGGEEADAVRLNVTLDLSGFRAEEVIQILKSLGLANS